MELSDTASKQHLKVNCPRWQIAVGWQSGVQLTDMKKWAPVPVGGRPIQLWCSVGYARADRRYNQRQPLLFRTNLGSVQLAAAKGL